MKIYPAKKVLRGLTFPLLSILTILGLGAANPSPVIFRNPAIEVADNNVYLPLVNRPGTTPPRIAGCELFPGDNIWNTAVDNLPVHPNSTDYIDAIGASHGLHADFGSGVWPPGSDSPIGIPYVVVPGSQPGVPVTFFWWPEESDDGPYPIPPGAPIQGGPASDGDRHVLVVDSDNCILYEMYYAFPQPDGSWEAANGAMFDLNSHKLRPDNWTSADAAGLPILPGLIRYDEVVSGEMRHAVRFTAAETQAAHIWPARHNASSVTAANYPPMGLRLRLRADYDLSPFSAEVRVILQALKTYGLILSDNGSPWYLSGAPDERWDNDMLHEMDVVSGADFEVVDVSSLMVDPDSGQAATP